MQQELCLFTLVKTSEFEKLKTVWPVHSPSVECGQNRKRLIDSAVESQVASAANQQNIGIAE